MPRRQGGQAGRVRVQRPPEALPLPSVAALSGKAARLSGQRDRRPRALVLAFSLLPDLPEQAVTAVHHRTSRARRGGTDRPDQKNQPPRPSPIAWEKLQDLSRSVGSGGSSVEEEFHREQPSPMNLSHPRARSPPPTSRMQATTVLCQTPRTEEIDGPLGNRGPRPDVRNAGTGGPGTLGDRGYRPFPAPQCNATGIPGSRSQERSRSTGRESWLEGSALSDPPPSHRQDSPPPLPTSPLQRRPLPGWPTYNDRLYIRLT